MADTSGTPDVVDELAGEFAEEEQAASSDLEQMAQAERSEESELSEYTNNVMRLKNSVASLHETSKSMGLKVKQNEVQKRAAEIVSDQNAVLSVSQVLQLIETEKEAKRAKKKAESRYFKAALTYTGRSLTSAAKVMFSSGAGESFLDGQSESDGKSGIVALAGGAMTALVLGGSESVLGNAAVNMYEGYVALKEGMELDEGVEEKTLEGLGDENEFAAYAEANANGEADDPYARENAGGYVYTGSGKTLAAPSGGYVAETTADALTASIDDFNIDKIIETVEAEAGGNTPSAGSLADSVSTSADTPSTEKADTPTYERSGLAQMLMDQQEQEQADTSGIPEVPDITD